MKRRSSGDAPFVLHSGSSDEIERREAIFRAEEELVSAKKWYEKGEVLASERPKNSLLAAQSLKRSKRKDKKRERCESDEEDWSSTGLEDKLEFARNKMEISVTTSIERDIRRILRQRVKDKSYDNPQKKDRATSKERVEKVIAETGSEDASGKARVPLHDVYEGKRSVNDSFMERSQLIALFNEIDRDLAGITDQTYVPTRPIVAKPKSSQA